MVQKKKRDRFIRVAEYRTQRVLDALQSLSNCASRVSYDYTPAQVEQIFSAIEAELQRTKARYDGEKQFSLSDVPKLEEPSK